MSYAVRNDGLGWRAVNGADDVGNDETFSETVPSPVLELPSFPTEIAALQGLLAIDQAGMADEYEAWATNPARTFAERAFINKALTWKRNDPTLALAAASLGLTDAQVDGMFELAATL